jgi:hypothetical protein
VLLSYLPRGANHELLLKFGFSERGNPHYVLPWWAMEPLEALVAAGGSTTTRLSRCQLLRAAGLAESDGGGASSPASLRFVDVDVADDMGDEQAERVVAAARGLLEVAYVTSDPPSDQVLSAASASTMLSYLEAVLGERVPAIDDIARLSEDNKIGRAAGAAAGATAGDPSAGACLTPCERTALEFRCEAKLVVHAAVDILRRYVEDDRNHRDHCDTG